MKNAQSSWDSEKRNSPFSTVADIEDEYCDACGDAHTCPDCLNPEHCMEDSRYLLSDAGREALLVGYDV